MIKENELQHPEEFSISNIFSNTEYKIPIYQRSYAWTKEEIEQLLNDINDSTGRYYIGNLIVDHIETNTYMVIDGQQRLTTLFLLLSYLKDVSISSSSLSFEAREKSNRTLKYLANSNEKIIEDSLYSSEILSGYKVISNYFETIEQSKKEEFLINFKSKLDNILIIRTLVPKKIDLNHYFEIMNTRGEQLEIHEVAKGRLIGVINNPNDKELAAYIWDSCAQMDKYVQMCFDPNSRENIFGTGWNSFKPRNFEELRSEVEIKSILSGNKFSLDSKLNNPVDNSKKSESANEENERFESIITFPNFLLIANEALKKDSGEDDSSLDDKKFITELEKNWESNDSALDFIFNLLKLKFLFDKYIIKREFVREHKEDGRWSLQHLEMYQEPRNDKQKKPLYKLTYNVSEDDSGKEKTEQLRTLQSALRITYTSPKTMHWISIALNRLNQNEAVDLTAILEKYACTKVSAANYKTASGFGVDRIVFTYLDYILFRDNKEEFGKDFQFQFRTSIEHFYPQHPIEDKIWPNVDLNCFGNLALITVVANSKFSNLPPDAKVISYKDVIKQSPKLMRMEKLMNIRHRWTEKEVHDHDEEMKTLLELEINKHLGK